VDTAVVQSANSGGVGAIASTIPIAPAQENSQDALTHKHTWNNKELAERRRSISPRSKDPEEARKLLARGIERIKSRSIDDHGYRKLQGLINYHDHIFQDEQKYDEMLLALLNALETPNTEKRAPLGRRFDNKFQVLVTIRLMFVHNRKYFAAYFPRAMSALLIARRNFESRNHIVSGLEETAQDITAACIPPDVIDAVMDVLETEERDEAGSRTIAMGLHILSGLSARLRELHAAIEPLQEKRMAKFALTCLREPTSIVRRAVIEYCLELKRLITPEARFFRLVTGDNEDFKNLITYYAANSIN
jgi:CLIP-associating protein 1/2